MVVKPSYDEKMNASEFINQVRERPPPFKFSTWLYNDREGTIMGRTGSSWGKPSNNNNNNESGGAKPTICVASE